MAKVKIMGDAIQIKTELTKQTLDRVKALAPDALKLFDNEGNEVFGIECGDPSYSKYGICFNTTDSSGKLFMTCVNPVVDHDDVEKEKEEVVKHFAPIINKLEAIERNVSSAAETLQSMENSVRESVEFVTE